MTLEEEEEDGGASISLKFLRIPHSTCAHLFIDVRDFLGAAKHSPASFSTLSAALIAAGAPPLPRVSSPAQHPLPSISAWSARITTLAIGTNEKEAILHSLIYLEVLIMLGIGIKGQSLLMEWFLTIMLWLFL